MQHCTYRLVESYRNNDSVRHHTILNLGTLTLLADTEQKRELGLRIEQLVNQDTTGIQELYPTCAPIVEQLGIANFLHRCQWSEEDVKFALNHISSRTAYPASELRTSRWITPNSAICELTGYPAYKITKDKLCKIALKLYAVKDRLEQHLSLRNNDLFDLDDKIIIYDLTNTYFEGAVRKSKVAR